MGHDIRSGQDRQEQQDDADDAGPEDVIMPPDVQVNPHDDGDGHGGHDGKGPPGAVEHGIDHGNGEAGQGEDEDKQDGHRSDAARGLADFTFGNFGQTLTLVPDRGEEHHHIMHGAGQNGAQDDPQGAGQIAELGRQHRPQQGPGRGDGRKVVAEQDKFIGFDIIMAIGHFYRRSQSLPFEFQDFIGNEEAVEAVADGKYCQGHQDQSQCIHIYPSLCQIVTKLPIILSFYMEK